MADLARPEVGAEAVRDFPTWPAPRRIPLWWVGGHEVCGGSPTGSWSRWSRDCWQGNGRFDGHPLWACAKQHLSAVTVGTAPVGSRPAS